jgi:hypothetical protein
MANTMTPRQEAFTSNEASAMFALQRKWDEENEQRSRGRCDLYDLQPIAWDSEVPALQIDPKVLRQVQGPGRHDTNEGRAAEVSSVSRAISSAW